MSIRHLVATLLPVVPVASNMASLERTSGVRRNLQSGLFAPEEGERRNISAPIYSPEECDRWIDTLVSNDEDGSDGLSESEYYAFFSSIDDPPYVAAYFENYGNFNQLPWVFRVVHKTLACHCEKIGFGKECCEGDGAEVLLQGLADGDGNGGERNGPAEAAYRDLFCQQISYVLTKSIPSPAPTDGPTGGPTRSPIPDPTASPSGGPSPAPVTDGPTRAPAAAARTAAPSAALVTTSPTPAPSDAPVTPAPSDPAPTYAPIVREVPAATVRSAERIEAEDGGSNAGIIVGIVFACLAATVALVAFVAYRRRVREREMLRRFAGERATDDDGRDWEAPPSSSDGSGWDRAPPSSASASSASASAREAAVAVPLAREPYRDDDASSSAAPSVWSESNEGGDALGELMHDGHREGPGVPAGSALAAMGAASTFATRSGGEWS